MLGNRSAQGQLRNFAHEIVVKRVRRVGGAVVMWIPKLRGIRPDNARNPSFPERHVVAAVQISKGLLNSKIDFESKDS